MASGTSHIALGEPPLVKPASHSFILRPARLTDVQTLAEHATAAYWDTPVARFLAPNAALYRQDLVRTFKQSIRRRYSSQRNTSLVACLATSPEVPIAYIQFARLGNDEGAERQIRSRGLMGNIWLALIAWWFWRVDGITNYLSPDRAMDKRSVQLLEQWGHMDEEKYWNRFLDRANRWHVQSLVVGPEWQGKGVGRLLMNEALKKAQAERIIAGLSSSPQGEMLYRKLGFELLGDFSRRVGGDDVGGGIMMWRPEGGVIEREGL